MFNEKILSISLSTLNCKNLKANLFYCEYLNSISNITFFNELWLTPSEKNILDRINSKNHKIIFKSDMDFLYTRGRPFGGQAWFIDSNFKIIEFKFINRYISFILIGINSLQIAIIGTYMPFDDGSGEKLSQYEVNLSIILALKEKFDRKNTPTFLIGDFNADLFRSRKFDKLLLNYTINNALIPLETLNLQKIDHTFKADLGNLKSNKANIDHIFCDQNSVNILSNLQCNILDDIANMSDHNAIKLDFSIPTGSVCQNEYDSETINRPKIVNFNNEETLLYFQSILDPKIDELNHEFFDPNQFQPTQENLDNLYNRFCQILNNAYELSYDFQLNLQSNMYIHKKNKKLMTPELLSIKNKLISLRNQFVYNKDPKIFNEIKIQKKLFRSIQRNNIFLDNMKEFDKLESIARKKNKDKFWKFINNKKKKLSNTNKIDITIEDLTNHFKKLFSEDYNDLNNEQTKIEVTVFKTFDEFLNKPISHFFSMKNLEKVLKTLKNSNVKGHDGIDYNMLKSVNPEKLQPFLLGFFNYFLSAKSIPLNFNISIINPILKKHDKPSNDMNNIRPISISNCLAQIFEKLILESNPTLSIIHQNQFGFKKNTSCNHAIFAFKETVLSYIEGKSECRAASLDAEKAFDKVWRNGLFYKLIEKMNISHWYLLKKYYDQSWGTIMLYSISSELFKINCGVKQGGILSPFLFNIYINDLFILCIEKNIGAILGNCNLSIIGYADDIVLISPNDAQLQTLLDICTEFGSLWKIKFNPSKSNIISFGDQSFPNNNFILNGLPLVETDKIIYLGIEINNTLVSDASFIEKFKKVQKTTFSLSFIGMKPLGVSPLLQSFLYKTYCLSTFTYGLETTSLLKKTRDYLNIAQNDLIRNFIGIGKYSHMTNLLKCLKIFNFENLYIFSKLTFLNMLKSNSLCVNIINHLIKVKYLYNSRSKSFLKDLELLIDHFKTNFDYLLKNSNKFKADLKAIFSEKSGLIDTIKFCLFNYKDLNYRNYLKRVLNAIV